MLTGLTVLQAKWRKACMFEGMVHNFGWSRWLIAEITTRRAPARARGEEGVKCVRVKLIGTLLVLVSVA
jgi:hypothetical protein